MAIVWGDWSGHMRAGVEFTTDSYTATTPTINVYVKTYIQIDSTWNFADNQHMSLTGSVGGEWDFYNGLQKNQSLSPGTATIKNQGQRVGGGPVYTVTARVSGAYNGAAPWVTASFSLPPKPATVPGKPGISVSGVTSTSAHVSVTAAANNGSGITAYETDISKPGADWSANLQTWAGGSGDATGLTAATVYQARTRAKNALGWGPYAYSANFKTGATPPSAPVAPTIGAVDMETAAINWVAPADGGSAISGYTVQYSQVASFSNSGIDLTDDFSTVDTTKWTYRSGASIVSGQLVLSDDGSYSGQVDSVNRFDLTGNQCQVQLVRPASSTAGTSYTTFKLYSDTPNGNSLELSYDGTNLFAQHWVNGVSTWIAGTSYSSSNDQWLRIRESGGTIYWETSADGSTWATLASEAKPISVTSLFVELSVGGGTSGQVAAIFDNLTFGNPAGSGVPPVTVNFDGSVSTGTISGLRPGTRYYVRVAAVNGVGSSAWSASASLLTLAPPIVRAPVDFTLPSSAAGWQFVLVAPGTPQVDLTDLTTARSRKLSVKLNDSSSASFSINGRNAEAAKIAPLITDLVVTRNNTKLFRGRVGTTQHALTADAHTTDVSVWDYRELLKRRLLLPPDTTVYTQTDQEAIGWDLIAQTQAKTAGDLGIQRAPGQTTDVLRDRTFDPGSKVGDLIDQLSQVEGGFEWEISPDLVYTVFYPQRGATLPTFVMELGGSILSATDVFDPSTFANVINMVGGSPPTPAAPSNLNGAPASGGTLAAGQYCYRVSSFTQYGEGESSQDIVVTTTATGSVKLTWDPVPEALGYYIYGRTNGQPLYRIYLPTAQPVSAVYTTTWTDNGSATLTNIGIPGNATFPVLTDLRTADDLDGAPMGRWESQVSESDITDASTLAARAMYELNLAAVYVPTWQVKLDPAYWSGPEVLWVGDQVLLSVQSGAIDEDSSILRVIQMDFDISDDGEESITVTLGTKPLSIYTRISSVTTTVDALARR